MKNLFKLTLLILPLSLSSLISLAKDLDLTHKNSSKLEGCIQNAKILLKKQSVLNSLSKKVQFTNSENPSFSLSQRMKALNVNAVSIAVIKNNKIDWSEAHSISSLPSNSMVNCNTLFQAASISKPVTMMAVLRMSEQRELNIDQNIEHYLTDFSLPKGKQTIEHPVTFKNILTHTSGITPGGYRGYVRGTNIPLDIDIVKGVAPANSKAIEVISVPGTQLMYSGGAYTLAELALQDRFKQPFEKIMQDWVLLPAGMKTASFSQPIAKEKYKEIASGHNFSGIQLEGGWNIHPEQAAAGLWSNANDLALFASEIGKGFRDKSDLFSKALVNELLHHKIDGHLYGFIAMGENEDLAIAHYGGNVGYRTAMVLNVVSGDGVVILTNSDNGSSLINEILVSLSNEYRWPHFKSVYLTKTNVEQKRLQNFSGKYFFENQGFYIDISYDKEANNISVIFPNKDVYPLTATTKLENHFVHPDTGVEAVFTATGDSFQIKLYGQIGTKI